MFSTIKKLFYDDGIKEMYVYVAVGTAFLCTAGYNYLFQPWTLDDAYITFRYVENFVNGKGLVFNEGEYVEGYTCFLWAMVLALPAKLGFDIPLTAKILGVVFTLASLALVSQLHRIIKGTSRTVSIASTIVLGTFPTFGVWAMSGMETNFCAFLMLLTVLYFGYLVSRDSRSLLGFFMLGILSALAGMSRPDALIILPVLGLATLWYGWSNSNSIRSAFMLGLGFALLFLPYFCWRYFYYGWLLPNTFYVKVGTTIEQIKRGIEYTDYFVKSSLLLWVPFLFVQLFSLKSFGRIGVFLFVISGAFFLHCVYVILVGGDCMPAYRFYATIAPIFIVAGAYALANPSIAIWRAVVAIIVLAGFNFWQVFYDKHIYDRILSDKVAFKGKIVGLWLRENVPPNSLLATNAAGAVPYYSKLRTIDMLGLCDEHIAHREIPNIGKGFAGHEKGDGKYVLSREPDYIMFGSSTGSKTPRFLSDKEISSDPIFREKYRYKQYIVSTDVILHIYEKIK